MDEFGVSGYGLCNAVGDVNRIHDSLFIGVSKSILFTGSTLTKQQPEVAGLHRAHLHPCCRSLAPLHRTWHLICAATHYVQQPLHDCT